MVRWPVDLDLGQNHQAVGSEDGSLQTDSSRGIQSVYALVQLSDGTLASGSYDKTIKLWDPKTGACKQTLQGHTFCVMALVQLSDGTLASGSSDKTIKLWDPTTGACKQTLQGHTDGVHALVQLSDGTLASGSLDKTIKLWQ